VTVNIWFMFVLCTERVLQFYKLASAVTLLVVTCKMRICI